MLFRSLAAFQDASTPDLLEKFLRRLASFPRLVEDHLARVNVAMSRGVTASRISVERLIAQLEGLAAIPPEHSPIATAARVAGDAERARVVDAVREHVDPQIRRYLDLVKGPYRGKCREVPGLVSLPDGGRLYATAVRRSEEHTSELQSH